MVMVSHKAVASHKPWICADLQDQIRAYRKQEFSGDKGGGPCPEVPPGEKPSHPTSRGLIPPNRRFINLWNNSDSRSPCAPRESAQLISRVPSCSPACPSSPPGPTGQLRVLEEREGPGGAKGRGLHGHTAGWRHIPSPPARRPPSGRSLGRRAPLGQEGRWG